MQKTIAYTPPDLAGPRSGPVRRRQVFFVPGYDPEGGSRYRLLFVRELARHAKRFGLARFEVTRAAVGADGLAQSWSIAPNPSIDGAATAYEVLLWDDIVACDFRRSRVVSVALLVAGTLYAALCGGLFRFYRLNWKYGNVILYPFVMVVLLTLLSGVIGILVHAHLGDWFGHSLGLPPWVSLPAALLAGLGWIKLIEAFLNRLFFWQLLNDWVFNWQHGHGLRADYARRVEAFADRILARLAERAAEGDVPDEVMIVGHSTGGLTAVEAAIRVLARDPRIGTGPTALSLATLGSGLPLVALHPRAGRLRAAIADLIASPRLVWCDFQAPQDWMNFPGFNPVLDLGLPPNGPIANPLVRSAQFRQVLGPETYAKVRLKPFRMHFQFLLANERPGAYDYFLMTLGPQCLRDRAVDPLIGPQPVCASDTAVVI